MNQEPETPSRSTIILVGHAGVGKTAAIEIAKLRAEHPTAEILTEQEAYDKYPNLRQYIQQSGQEYLTVSEMIFQKLDIEAMELAMLTIPEEPKAVKEHIKNYQSAQNRRYNNMFNSKQKYTSKPFKRNKV